MPELDQPTGILDIGAEEYFSIRALSNSGMNDLMVSPLRFWHLHVNPKREEVQETAAMRIGTALHCAVLEGADAFESRYAKALDKNASLGSLVTVADLREWISAVGAKPKGPSKDGLIAQAKELGEMSGIPVRIFDEERAAYEEACAGKTILSAEEWDRVDGMCHALRMEPAVQRLLRDGRPEVPMVCEDPETGVLLKCKLDWMGNGVTLDLKSFAQKRGLSIDKSVCDAIWYEGYYRQAYFYEYIRRIVTGEKSKFVLAFVESDPPHETRIKSLQPRSDYESNLYWQRAEAEVRAMIRLYADYLDRFGERPWRNEQTEELLIDADMRQLAY